MTDRLDGPRSVIHTPSEIGGSYLRWAESRRDTPGIPFDIPAVDERVIPIQPGDLVSFIARPGHAKTSVLAKLARDEAQRIIERGAQGRECVVFATWEQSAEELNAMFEAGCEYSISDLARGRVDLDIVRRQATQRAGLPIWVIGHGIGRSSSAAIRLTPDVVLAALEAMESDFNGMKPTLMLFDYLQLIPSRNHTDRVQQVTEMPIKIKELALRIGVPAVCAVQAARRVDERDDKMPTMADAQWASSIEQTCDKIFGLMRPIRYWDDGVFVEIAGKMHKVNEYLLVMRMLKQRFEQGSYTWPLHFNPATFEMGAIETRREER